MADDPEQEHDPRTLGPQPSAEASKSAPAQEPLVVATHLSLPSDAVKDARALVAAALWELEAAAGDDGRQAEIHHALGTIIERRLEDPRRALFHLQQARKLAPENLAVIRALRRHYWSRQNWVMVLELLEAELGLVGDPARQAVLLLQQGRIYEEWLVNGERAQRFYLEALSRQPGNRQALVCLRRLFSRRQDQAALLDVCRKAAAATTDRKYRGLLLAEMGRVHEEMGADPEAAIAAYAAAFVEDPALASVRAALKRLYGERERWADMVEVLLSEGDLAQENRERAGAYASAARICRDRLDQLERALELFSRSWHLDGQDASVLREMALLLNDAGRFEELAAVYQDLLACVAEDSERVLVHFELGQLLDDRLGRQDEALIHYRRAVSTDPTYVPALQALGRLCRKRGMWAELVEMNEAEAETILDEQARAIHFFQLAALCEERLGDRAKAIEYHRRALACVGDYSPSLRALEQLYTEVGDWEALVALWEAGLEHLGEAQAVWQLSRLGQVCADQLQDLGRARRFLARAVELDRDNVALIRTLHRWCLEDQEFAQALDLLDREVALTEEQSLALSLRHQAALLCEIKLGRLEEATGRYQGILQQEPAYGPSVAALGRIYHRRENWQGVLELYLQEVEQGRLPPKRRGTLLFKIGEIRQRHLGDEAGAIEAYQRALDVSPAYSPALQALAGVFRRQQKWEELVAVMRRQADALVDEQQRAAVLFEIGQLCESRLHQQNLAVHLYRQALELRPDNELCRSALLRVFSAEERWPEVVEVYQEALGGTADPLQQAFFWKRMGDIWDQHLQNPQRAIECFERALEHSPEDREALEGLTKLLRRVGEFAPLAECFKRLALRARDLHEAVGFLFEAAAILEAYVPEEDPVPLYERIFQLDSEQLAALEALERLYSQRGDNQALIEVYEAHLGLEQDAVPRTALLRLLAQVRECQGDLEGAELALREAAGLADDWVTTRELRLLAEKLSRWDVVAQCLEQEAASSRNTFGAVESLMKAAALYLDPLDDPERAASVYARALELDPFNTEAAERLEQILVPQEAWARLAEAYQRRLASAEAQADQDAGGQRNRKKRIELLSRLAWIQREHLHAPREAVDTLARAQQLDPNHLPTLLTLGELQMAQEQWQEAINAFSRVVAVSDDPHLLRTAHFQLGDLYYHKAEDLRQAISCYQNVLAVAPDDVTALNKLFELFKRNRDWENAADTVNRLIDAVSDSQQLVSYLAELAQIQEKGFGDPQLAAEQLQRALSIVPTDVQVLERFSRLCHQLEKWDALSDALRSFLVALPSDQEGRGIQYRLQLGELLRQRLGRTAEALEQYRAVVEIDPTNVDARLATAAILAAEGRLDEAITEHREVHGLDALNIRSLRQMRNIWIQAGKAEEAYQAGAVLVCLGEAQEAEEAAYRERRSKGVSLPSIPPSDRLLEETLIHPLENPLVRRVLSVLCDVAHRIRPARLGDWQVTKSDRLPPRSEDPLKVMTREVAGVLGIEREVEVFISPARPREMDLLFTDPPSLVAGAGVIGSFPSMEVRFRVAQLLSQVSHRTWVAHGLGGADLSRLLRAAVAVVEPPGDGDLDGALAEMARMIQRSLSRRGRKLLEEACRTLPALHDADAADWTVAMQHTALRTALWAVNDLETALSWLSRLDMALARPAEGGSITARVRRSAVAVELIHFWLGDGFGVLRRATGL